MVRIAVVLSEASVRVSADTGQGEADAARAGEDFGRAFAAGADRTVGRSNVPATLVKQVQSASREIAAARREEVAASAAVEAATARITKAHDAEADATGRVRVAETSLGEARSSGSASATQLAAAEERVESAHRKLVASQTAVTSAEESGRSATERLTAAHSGAAEAAARHSSALRAVGSAAEDTGSKVGNAGKDVDGGTSAFDRLKKAATDAGSALGRGGPWAAFAPLLVPAVQSVVALSGALALVPAAAFAAGTALATVKIGTSGLSDAFKTAAKTTEAAAAATAADAKAKDGSVASIAAATAAHAKLSAALDEQNQKLSKLAPSARDFVVQVTALAPAFTALKLDVQQRLFTGLGSEIRRMGALDLPVLRTGLGLMATSLNGLVKQFTEFATSKSAVADYTTIFANSAKAADSFRAAVKPVLQIFTDLTVVGSSFLPGLATGFANAAQKAADFVHQARESGKLREFIQSGIDAFKTLFRIVGDLTVILKDLGTGNTGLPGLLDILKAITGVIRFITENIPGGTFLVEAFIIAWRLAPIVTLLLNMRAAILANTVATKEAGVAAEVTGGKMAGAWKVAGVAAGAYAIGLGLLAVGQENTGTGFKNVAKDAADTAGKVLTLDIGGLFAKIGRDINSLPTDLQNTKEKWSGIFSAMGDTATGFSSAVHDVFTGLAARVTGTVVGLVDTVKGHFVDQATSVTGSVGGMSSNVTGSFGTLAVINGATVGGFVGTVTGFFGNLSGNVTGTVGGLVSNVTGFFQNLAGNVSGTVGGLVGNVVGRFNNLAGSVGGIVSGAVGYVGSLFVNMGTNAYNGLAGGLNSLIGFVGGIPGRILGALGSLGTLLFNSGVGLVSGFFDGVVSRWSQLVDWIRTGLGNIRALFPFSPALEGPFSGRGYVTYSGAALTGDFADSILRGIPGVVAAARQLAEDTVKAGHVDLSAVLTALPAGTAQVQALVGAGRTPGLDAATPTTGTGTTVNYAPVFNNPIAEKATDSSNRELRRFAALGGFR